MRKAVPVAALLMLAACNPSPGTAPTGGAGTGNETAAADPKAAPAKPSGFDWEGEWAATADKCGVDSWHFRPRTVTTDYGGSCGIGQAIVAGPRQAMIDMACAGGNDEPRNERWTLTETPDGKMNVTRSSDIGIFADVVLERCKPAAE